MTLVEHPMRPPREPAVVLVLNGVLDIIEMFRMYFELHGWIVVSGEVDRVKRGQLDVKTLVEAHRPAVVIYDVPPPYETNWRYLQVLRTTGPLRDIPIILTCTNERRLREMVTTDEAIIEVFGKPFDMEQVVRAAAHAVSLSASE